MGGLNNFYKQNIVPAGKEIEFILSDRFVERDDNGEVILDQKGEPKLLKFKMKVLKPKRFMDLASGQVGVDKNGINLGDDFVSNSSFALLSECLVYPNLRDAGLQDSFGVTSVAELIDEMFTVSEVQDLLDKANAIHNKNVNFEDKVQEVKN